METWEGLLLSLSWFLLRFGVPILATLLIALLFNWLDARWQRDALERRASLGAESRLPVVRCWEINECPGEKCQNCVAFQNQGTPCWQHFRAADGALKESCLGCKVFLGVSAPAIGD